MVENLLETAITRKSALAALAEGPHHRRDLQAELDVSKATCHRIVRSFDEQGLLRRTEDGYELTELGRVVATQVQRFEDTVQTAKHLDPLLEDIAGADVGFEVELFSDATIVRARPNDPYPPVERFIELFRDSETLRNFGPTPVPPTMVNEVFELLFNEEKRVEIIKPRSIVQKYVSEYADQGRRAGTRGQLGVRVYDDLPFGVALYDDQVGLRGHDPESGTALVFAHTDAPEALAWGEAVFDHYREQSHPLSAFDEFPTWAQEELTLEL